ncbi:MAG: response regulator [Chloroflexi bacterium]|nr:MAG: response regulator [Chloroflexota bacterium]
MADKTILIVEDTVELAEMMMLALRALPNIHIHHAHRGEAALDWLEQNHVDLIVLDIAMPGMNGWEVLDVIKERVRAEGIKVIVTTAFTDPANRLIGKFQDIAVYMTKPYRITELRQVISEQLGL